MESRKAVAKYERVGKRLPYGEEEPYGAYEAPIPDYVMLDFGLFEEPRDEPEILHRRPEAFTPDTYRGVLE